MSKEQIQKLLNDMVTAYNQVAPALNGLTNQQLETVVKPFRNEQSARNALYGIGNHVREHSVHVQKVMQVTGAAGAHPTEAQNIMRDNNVALAAFISSFSLLNDEDLDKEFENQSPRKIIEHVKHAITTAGQAVISQKL